MRLPRVRITLRLLMIAVAALTLPLAALMRPYPVMIIGLGAVSLVTWSDGSSTTEAGAEPQLAGWEEFGPLVRVAWSDGSWSLHLKRPPRTLPARTGGNSTAQAERP